MLMLIISILFAQQNSLNEGVPIRDSYGREATLIKRFMDLKLGKNQVVGSLFGGGIAALQFTGTDDQKTALLLDLKAEFGLDLTNVGKDGELNLPWPRCTVRQGLPCSLGSLTEMFDHRSLEYRALKAAGKAGLAKGAGDVKQCSYFEQPYLSPQLKKTDLVEIDLVVGGRRGEQNLKIDWSPSEPNTIGGPFP